MITVNQGSLGHNSVVCWEKEAGFTRTEDVPEKEYSGCLGRRVQGARDFHQVLRFVTCDLNRK